MEIAKVLAAPLDLVLTNKIGRHYRGAVGAYYKDFRQVSDEDVLALLRSVGN